MNIVKTSLNSISLLFYSISLYYLFVKVQSVHSGVYYYAYENSMCWFLGAFVMAMFSRNVFSKINIGLYICTLIVVSGIFIYGHFDVDFYKNSSDTFFYSLLLGACNWFVALVLPIQFSHIGRKKKSIVIGCILLFGSGAYIVLRFLPFVWHLFRSEAGAHLIWLLMGNLVMLACSALYYKKVNNKLTS